MKDFLKKLWDNDAAMIAIVLAIAWILAWYIGTQT